MIDSNDSYYPKLPDRLYFSIKEAADLCLVQPHVLRYWEKQFTDLNPIKRNGRRYYTCQDIFSVREIRELLYVENFTIEGAKSQLKAQNKVKSNNQNQMSVINDAIDNLKQVIEILK